MNRTIAETAESHAAQQFGAVAHASGGRTARATPGGAGPDVLDLAGGSRSANWAAAVAAGDDRGGDRATRAWAGLPARFVHTRRFRDRAALRTGRR
jgi:hypothetical protein